MYWYPFDMHMFKKDPTHIRVDINTLVQPPLTLVQSLIAANPKAVTTKNHYGMIPLRTAIRSQVSTEVIGKI